ncbi:MAG TPA: hypothetical protein VL359_17120, partial [bacterium]|nr:hypothetical protein [bacterium]
MLSLIRSPRFWIALAVLALGLAALGWLLAWLIRIGAVVLLVQLNRWLADEVLRHLGYVGVFALMAIESSVIPLPSEIVMPPAGDLARRVAEWNLGGVIAAGTLGSIAGAIVNYWLAQAVGRPLL